jgi:hypothetical protein
VLWQQISPKRRLPPTGPHSIATQKSALRTFTATTSYFAFLCVVFCFVGTQFESVCTVCVVFCFVGTQFESVCTVCVVFCFVGTQFESVCSVCVVFCFVGTQFESVCSVCVVFCFVGTQFESIYTVCVDYLQRPMGKDFELWVQMRKDFRFKRDLTVLSYGLGIRATC